MEKKTLLWIGGVLIVVGGLLIIVATPRSSVAPAAPLPPAATTTAAVEHSTATTSPQGSAKPFPVNAADHIASWTFPAAYTDAAAIASAQADIAKLRDALGQGKYDDYDLYNGIANDYVLLGDGANAYAAYTKALAIHPTKGLVYANLGHFFDELRAPYTAADAYARAVAVEPGMLEYHVERLNYLREHFGNNNALMLEAFTAASKQFGDAAPILQIEARWLTDQKRYADAITAWERVKTLSLGSDTSAIDAEIARLKEK